MFEVDVAAERRFTVALNDVLASEQRAADVGAVQVMMAGPCHLAEKKFTGYPLDTFDAPRIGLISLPADADQLTPEQQALQAQKDDDSVWNVCIGCFRTFETGTTLPDPQYIHQTVSRQDCIKGNSLIFWAPDNHIGSWHQRYTTRT